MQFDHIEIAKLELQRGDVLLVRIPDNLNPTHVDGAVKEAMRLAGVNVPVLVGPKEVDFQVVRSQSESVG